VSDVVASLAGLDGRPLLEALVGSRFKGRIALVSSFGAESAVLLHMAASVDPRLPVIFLDTGKHFPETLGYRQSLTARLGLEDVRIVKPAPVDIARDDANGRLNRVDADRCCHIRKTLPLAEALHGFDAWISGRKRFHGGARSRLPTMEWSEGRLKVDPLVHFSVDDIRNYMLLHELPQHPLVARGYPSIGCAPCTARPDAGEAPRAGRWHGTDKTECGIHWTANGRLVRITHPGSPLPGGC
jgi:phosphoadenosine phosphosulfate reductase